ncbi:hypothetical protein [Nonomuraea sp. NPDC050310]|uniref:hypothetical protein n=1 Tax=Nonomuraea sp. NPDC050310 TaxID=3154935 RepID=UPI0033E7AF4B
MLNQLLAEYDIEPTKVDFSGIQRTNVRETVIGSRNGDHFGGVPGQSITIMIPYTGSDVPFHLTATTRRHALVYGIVTNTHVEFNVSASPRLTVQEIDQAVTRMQRELADRLQRAEQDILNWRYRLRDAVSRAITEHKRLLDHAEELSASLFIPLAPAPFERQIPIPVQRKSLRFQPAEPAPGQDEPHLTDAVYQDIVRTISGMGRALECTPARAKDLGEEGFRDLLLVVLNANYEGAVKGEVFNNKGKTDLHLTWQGRNAFIGECKMWRGPKKFSEAIGQLLGYGGWRDTKAALILFIGQGAPTDIIEKADAAIREHEAFVLAKPSTEPDIRQDYLLRSPSDPERTVTMAFLPLVVIPPAKSEAS